LQWQAASDPTNSRKVLQSSSIAKQWHKGVVGIVASRLVETFYKPTIVMVKDGDKLTGSARSIDGVDLFDALKRLLQHIFKNLGDIQWPLV
jgi:single-stranded-DNA-specific exonuclease